MKEVKQGTVNNQFNVVTTSKCPVWNGYEVHEVLPIMTVMWCTQWFHSHRTSAIQVMQETFIRGSVRCWTLTKELPQRKAKLVRSWVTCQTHFPQSQSSGVLPVYVRRIQDGGKMVITMEMNAGDFHETATNTKLSNHSRHNSYHIIWMLLLTVSVKSVPIDIVLSNFKYRAPWVW